MSIPIYLAFSPEEAAEAAAASAHLACMGYQLAPDTPAKFYKKITKEKMKKALKAGHMILFTEKNPIHTAVLMRDGKKIIRFSNGKYRTVTVAQEIRKRCGDSWYGGCVVVKKK